MIETVKKEYREGDNAVRTTSIAFFGIPIFRSKEITTNNDIVELLTVQKKTTIKGFKK